MKEANTNYVKYLIELSQKRRKNSYLELCSFNLQIVYALALRLTAGKSVAAEITVKIFVTAWENINHFREELPYTDWLKAISVYSILEEIRSGNLKNKLKVSDKEDIPESKYQIDRLVFKLPERERIIFVLHELEGYSHQEIADFLGDTSSSEVKAAVKRVRQEFVGVLCK